MLTFSERLKARRNAIGLSQEELAERASIAPRSVVAWEAGDTVPSIRKAGLVAGVLGVEVGWLLTGQGSMHQPRDELKHAAPENLLMGLRRLRAAVLDIYDRVEALERQFDAEFGAPSIERDLADDGLCYDGEKVAMDGGIAALAEAGVPPPPLRPLAAVPSGKKSSPHVDVLSDQGAQPGPQGGAPASPGSGSAVRRLPRHKAA